MGPFADRRRELLGNLGAVWNSLGPRWAIWGRFGRLLGHLGGILCHVATPYTSEYAHIEDAAGEPPPLPVAEQRVLLGAS